MVVSENLEQSRVVFDDDPAGALQRGGLHRGRQGRDNPDGIPLCPQQLPVASPRWGIGDRGAVKNPTTLTLDDLRVMPAVERVVTLECAGNGRLRQTPLPAGEPWGRLAVSTARWRGAFLYQVLEQARPATNGLEVKFEGADHGRYQQYGDLTFVRSLSLEHATDAVAEILIAYEMNGEPLNADHGNPFRLIVPRWYGVASVKWLKRIEVTTEPFQGEFEARHYMYEWADRPPEPVTVMPVRRLYHRPCTGRQRSGG